MARPIVETDTPIFFATSLAVIIPTSISRLPRGCRHPESVAES